MHASGLRTNRSGIALLLVLAMVLVLDFLVVGLLAVATRERMIADAAEYRMVAQFRSDAELRRARNHWSEVRRGAFTSVRVDSAADGLFLLRSTAARAQSALLVRSVPIRSLLRAFPAGVSTDGLFVMTGGSRIAADGVSTSECARDSVFALAGPGVQSSAQPPFVFPPSHIEAQPAVLLQTLPPLADVLLDSLALLAEYNAVGRLTFENVMNVDHCDRFDRIEHTREVQVRLCDDYWPFLVVDGDLSLAGHGHGILLVRGTLRLERAASFRGAILLAGGSFHAARDSQVFGAIRGSNARSIVFDAATLHFDLCMVWHALRNSDAMNQVLPIQRAWIPIS
jgi:hypothetical protein